MADKDDKSRDKGLWRDLVAYWILGLANNYGYMVMLSAAYDILHHFVELGGIEVDSRSLNETAALLDTRACNPISVGMVLLADVLPQLIVKLIIPYAPFWVNVRVGVAIFFSALGFLFIAFTPSRLFAYVGIILTSISSGIGETTFLGYTSRFNKNVISTWSSGTGGAAILGVSSYATLRRIGLGPRDTLLVMLVVPLSEVFAFWVLLRKPKPREQESKDEEESIKFTLKEKILYIQNCYHYQIPLCLVYFFEYLINQGLFELTQFRNTFISRPAQYRWFLMDYQVGVFISRSSVNIVRFRRIWIMAVLQAINLLLAFGEVFIYFTPSIWIVFAFILWEGLLGGGAYVNTFYRMAIELPRNEQELAMSLVVQTSAVGISSAVFVAVLIHNVICKLPAPDRMWEWNF